MAKSTHTCVTILFADIAGSTRLYEQLGDVRALELINHCTQKIHTITENCQGIVVKTIGDEVMCCFDESDQAGKAAMRMHETLVRDKEMSTYRIRLRIGMHYGTAIREEGDYYGDAVNIAARMVGQAKAGQIITTKDTIDQMGPHYKSKARLVDQTRVKGKLAIVEIYEIAWGHPEELTMISTYMAGHLGGENQAELVMILQYKTQSITINQKRPVITIGRDGTNHLVVDDPRVSRLHARIELRKDKFVLVDQSTNGTYILPGNGEIVRMRRDEVVLPKKGSISLGHQITAESPKVIKFQVIA